MILSAKTSSLIGHVGESATRKQAPQEHDDKNAIMCTLAGPVNVMLRKMLSPDMTHQLRAAVLPLEVWAVLSTGNVCGIWLVVWFRLGRRHRRLQGLVVANVELVKIIATLMRNMAFSAELNFTISALCSTHPVDG